MRIPVAVVVIDVDHFQMAGELVNHAPQVPTQMRMSRVETGPDGASADLPEQKHHIAGLPKEQMRQHVFEQELHPRLAAERGHLIE